MPHWARADAVHRVANENKTTWALLTYVHLHINLHTGLCVLFARVPLGINTGTHVCITYIHFLFETDIIPKKTKQYMKTASNLGKKSNLPFCFGWVVPKDRND